MTVPLRERGGGVPPAPAGTLGFRLVREEADARGIRAAYLEQQGTATVTAEHAITWAQLPQNVHPGLWTQRLTAVRGFAAWLRVTRDPATEIPPRGVFPGQGKRPAPFIFSDGDIAAMIAACGSLRPRMRAATCTALFGLIAVTGIRISEALSIPADGIDLGAGLLPVRPARIPLRAESFPLHPSTRGKPSRNTTSSAPAGTRRPRRSSCPSGEPGSATPRS